MTIVFAADVHVGNHRVFGGDVDAGVNQRACLAVRCLREAATRAWALRSPLVVLGDVFDDDRPNPQVIAAVQAAVTAAAHAPVARSGEVFLLAGNHDMTSAAPGHHALVPFALHATVVDVPRVISAGGVTLILLPYRPGPAGAYLRSALVPGALGDGHGKRVLGIHAGVRDAETAPWLRDAEDAIDVDELVDLAREHGISHVFAGNWHERRAWYRHGVRVTQVGSLCPTGFDDPSPEHGLSVLRDDGQVLFESVAGPRFVRVASQEELDDAVERAPPDCELYVTWVASGSDEALRAAQSAEALRERGVVAGWRLLRDGAAAAEQARDAARVVRRASTLDEALSAYVGGMGLPPDVPPGDVLAACRGYLS